MATHRRATGVGAGGVARGPQSLPHPVPRRCGSGGPQQHCDGVR